MKLLDSDTSSDLLSEGRSSIETFLEEYPQSDNKDSEVHIYCPWCFPDGDMSVCGVELNGDFTDFGDDGVDCILCRASSKCPICHGDLDDDEEEIDGHVPLGFWIDEA